MARDPVWDFLKRDSKQRQQQRKTALMVAADPIGWRQRTPYHWQKVVAGDLIDYWPSTDRWRWRGKTRFGAKSLRDFLDRLEERDGE